MVVVSLTEVEKVVLGALEFGFSVALFCGLYYKSFTIIIYNCNDSGQYYKTMNDAKILS